MDQEKIGKLIKEIRTSQKLSQQKFAEKYGVTYQAVSKWENGKNMPDITILKQICSDNNISLDDFLEAKPSKNKKSKKIFITILIIIILIFIISLLIFTNKKGQSFEFKTLSTACNNFNLYGSLAYNDEKSSIYISNITYCGGDDNNKYKEINCTLYETEENTKTKISSYNYTGEESIDLETFLKDVEFNVDNYKKTCKIYKENSLNLEIDAIDENGHTTSYKIPLTPKENCIN